LAPTPYFQRLGVQAITLTEKLQLRKSPTEKAVQQRRFFCENCKQEVFLQATYCDTCGGQIEWPEEISTVIASWKASKKQKKQK